MVVAVRVDAHDHPLDELARLLDVADAFDHYFRAENALVAGDAAGGLREAETAHTALPEDENILFVRAGALFFNGRFDEGRAAMGDLLARRPTWSTILRSFVDKGMFSIPPGVEVDEFLAP